MKKKERILVITTVVVSTLAVGAIVTQVYVDKHKKELAAKQLHDQQVAEDFRQAAIIIAEREEYLAWKTKKDAAAKVIKDNIDKAFAARDEYRAQLRRQRADRDEIRATYSDYPAVPVYSR